MAADKTLSAAIRILALGNFIFFDGRQNNTVFRKKCIMLCKDVSKFDMPKQRKGIFCGVKNILRELKHILAELLYINEIVGIVLKNDAKLML